VLYNGVAASTYFKHDIEGTVNKKGRIFNYYCSSKYFFTGISAGKRVCVSFPRSISAMKYFNIRRHSQKEGARAGKIKSPS
jgi:hypothetical protein